MTAAQITLVQTSFAAVAPDAQGAANAFYTRLFAADPSLRSLFRGNIREQGRKLMGMLGTVIAGLHQVERLLPAVEELGRRHAAYGVRDAHYLTVGEVLMGTLGDALGSRFTHEVQDAWAAAYAMLASRMMQAAAEHRHTTATA